MRRFGFRNILSDANRERSYIDEVAVTKRRMVDTLMRYLTSFYEQPHVHTFSEYHDDLRMQTEYELQLLVAQGEEVKALDKFMQRMNNLGPHEYEEEIADYAVELHKALS